MPLVTFSKILASKAFARYSQSYSSDTSGAQHLGNSSLIKGPKSPPRAVSSSGSRSSTPGKSPKQSKENTGRNRVRGSKIFTSLDPFNVVASFRTRSKIKGEQSLPESSLSSLPVSHQSLSLYSGYEDEEYGEPEVDAEEIRRPSGLGRRASLDIRHALDHGSIKEFQPVRTAAEGVESRSDVSDTSDIESLVEIRYPSGLGNIKQTIRQTEVERSLSTYPHFEPSVLDYDAHHDAHTDEDVPTPTQSLAPTALLRSPSVYLSTLLPMFEPYLSTPSLTSLTLVNRAVGNQARDLLWRNIKLSVTIHSAPNKKMSIDGLTSNKLLDFISTGDVAHLVKSLELTCRLENTTTRLTSNFSSRPRPPPLILGPRTATSLRSGNTLIARPASTQPRTSVMSLKTTPEARSGHDVVVTAPETGEQFTPSKKRRASLLLRNSIHTFKTNVPDALRTSAAKLRPTSLLPQTLFRPRSSEALGKSAAAHASQHSGSLSHVVESSALSFHIPSHVRDSRTPPAEWNRVGRDSSVLPSPLSAPLPGTGWRAPSEWLAQTSLSPPSSYPTPPQTSLHTRSRPPHWQFLINALTFDYHLPSRPYVLSILLHPLTIKKESHRRHSRPFLHLLHLIRRYLFQLSLFPRRVTVPPRQAYRLSLGNICFLQSQKAMCPRRCLIPHETM
ncbi:hypothetical protein JB92DRAFT_3114157 [Gautieria morchelliformis]|nr:hypothetical protein JB92DRAFT_3114157 [Gautieria morchelliformis]